MVSNQIDNKTVIWTDSTWRKTKSGNPRVILFGRNPYTLKATSIGIDGINPYYWAHQDDYNEVNDTDIKSDIFNCFGEPIIKVEVSSPDRINVEKHLYNRTYEADISFDLKYTIDKKIFYAFDQYINPTTYNGDFIPKIGYYDIEVRSPKAIMPYPEKPRFPIVCFSLADSYSNRVWVYALNGGQIDQDAIIERIEKSSGFKCELIYKVFGSETKMMKVFAELVHDENFDIMTAWNGSRFDDPYVVNRAESIGADISSLSRLKGFKVYSTKWTGRILADQMLLFEDWSKPQGKMPYNLKYVASKFCDFTYENQGSNIDLLMEEGRWDEIIEYSACDAVAQKLIDQKTNLFGFYENIRKVMGCKFNDTLSRTKSIETLLMKKGIKPMPNKTMIVDDVSVTGGLVLKPEAGVYTNVGVFDATALYPSIIIANDLSPDIDKMIPKVIVEMMEEREKLRAIRMAGNASDNVKNAEIATKYIVNSFYGYMLFKRARLYDREIGAKITGEGRKIIRAVAAFADKQGFQVVYGDTDSTFAKGIYDKEVGLKLSDEINEFLKRWAVNNGIDVMFAPSVKFEKLYGRIMFKMKAGSTKRMKKAPEAAKKRYAGWLIWKDGFDVDLMDFTGVETKRSDASAITRKAMEEFFEIVLRENDIPKACGLIKDTYVNMTNGKYNIQDVGLPRGIKSPKENAWTKGMINATKLWGTRWDEYPRPKLLHCHRPVVHICVDNDQDDIPIGDNGKPMVEINWKVMADKNIKNKFESLLLSIGKDWDGVVIGQRTLFDF